MANIRIEDRSSALHCPQCGYALVGLPDEHTCPECGFRYQRAAVESLVRREFWAQLTLNEIIVWYALAALTLAAVGLLTQSTGYAWLGYRPRNLTIVALVTFQLAYLARRWTGFESEAGWYEPLGAWLGWSVLLLVAMLKPAWGYAVAAGLVAIAAFARARHRPAFPALPAGFSDGDRRVLRRWRAVSWVATGAAALLLLATLA